MIIGIAGPSASGKTTLARTICNLLKTRGINSTVISMDDYYIDSSHLTKEEMVNTNFDCPEIMDFKLLKEHLNALIAGKEVQRIVYMHKNCKRVVLEEKLKPSETIILEGLYALYDSEINNKIDLKIFLDSDLEECFRRRLKRSTEEKDREKYTQTEAIAAYSKFVVPMYHLHIEPTRENADLILRTNKDQTNLYKWLNFV